MFGTINTWGRAAFGLLFLLILILFTVGCNPFDSHETKAPPPPQQLETNPLIKIKLIGVHCEMTEGKHGNPALDCDISLR